MYFELEFVNLYEIHRNHQEKIDNLLKILNKT